MHFKFEFLNLILKKFLIRYASFTQIGQSKGYFASIVRTSIRIIQNQNFFEENYIIRLNLS